MHEISPVLAGTFDAADYKPAAANFNRTADTSSATAATDVDARRYTKFDRSASQVSDAADFSFGDFLDMVNPLQHIPVVSSVYRAVTGDSINPVSRVAGDIMYGGALGVVSAVIGGTSAVADAVNESQTGHDRTGAVLASLFGVDSKVAAPATQVAQVDDKAAPAALSTAAATPVTPAPLSAPTQNLNQSIPKTADQNLTLAGATGGIAASPTAVGATTDVASKAVADAATPIMQGKSFPLNRQAYGGVMAPANSLEDQNRIIALSQGSHAMRLGHTIYTNPMMNGPHPLPPMAPAPATSTATAANSAADVQAPATAGTATAPAPQAATTAAATTNKNPLPQNLIDDMIMMKAIGQYKGVANSAPATGSTLDVQN